MANLLYLVTWTDGKDQYVTSWSQSAQDTNVLTAIQACSLGSQIQATASTSVLPNVGPVPVHVNVQVGARLTFVTANANRAYIVIPAVDPAVFLADGETVDPANTAINALATVLISEGITSGGEALTQFVGGLKVFLTPQPYTL